ncbi:hypothetical protein LY90DRAFT_219859 [Neocallimastix californiae]|uniref:Uncharacterized protein n=1 Tax=Neocallimastix californiae TaxID=1754190 RepID=A0A1Y1YW83_9FUNG|nr:hypothetical protein LY90DRAFT_219859 [Neocallimastix californiae]|eukprot:ORY02206.1 hypothetical protein LY90DRAFT_219859 [Neocallimastix californiae]
MFIINKILFFIFKFIIIIYGSSCPIKVNYYDNIGNEYKIPYYKRRNDDLRRRIDRCSFDLLNDLASYLTPSCNWHDACYHCEKKDTCYYLKQK